MSEPKYGYDFRSWRSEPNLGTVKKWSGAELSHSPELPDPLHERAMKFFFAWALFGNYCFIFGYKCNPKWYLDILSIFFFLSWSCYYIFFCQTCIYFSSFQFIAISYLDEFEMSPFSSSFLKIILAWLALWLFQLQACKIWMTFVGIIHFLPNPIIQAYFQWSIISTSESYGSDILILEG